MPSSRLQEVLDRGEAECFPTRKHAGGLTAALASFGLKPDPSGLSQVTRAEAIEILVALLSAGMAYGESRVPEAEAPSLAEEILLMISTAPKVIYSNGNWARHKGWNPMTDSTFDSGLVVESEQDEYGCVWFRDED